MKLIEPDPIMIACRRLFEQSGRTLADIGEDMGYEGDVARKSVWQFLNHTTDPRMSTLRAFATALSITIDELIHESKELVS